jgi:hypothetical protein
MFNTSFFFRRTSLPVAQFSRGDFSLWSVLKNCVGKELSKITMPVVFNEPLSFLQRMLEYLEYAHLLRMASEQTDPVARMEYIAGIRNNYKSLLNKRLQIIHTYTYIPLTLHPRRGSRGISNIPPRHPRSTKIS